MVTEQTPKWKFTGANPAAGLRAQHRSHLRCPGSLPVAPCVLSLLFHSSQNLQTARQKLNHEEIKTRCRKKKQTILRLVTWKTFLPGSKSPVKMTSIKAAASSLLLLNSSIFKRKQQGQLLPCVLLTFLVPLLIETLHVWQLTLPWRVWHRTCLFSFSLAYLHNLG